MSVPLILTLLAGAATFIGAFLGVLGQKPSNRLLAFSLGFAAGIMLLISLMEMLPAALGTKGMPPVLGYGMFIIGLLGYFGLDRLLPHAHPQDLVQKERSRFPARLNVPPSCSRWGSVCTTSRKGLPPTSPPAVTWSWDSASRWQLPCIIFRKVWRSPGRSMRPPVLNVPRFSGRAFPGWRKYWVACWRG